MQVDWELSKENFQPLKRGRKEVSKPVCLSEGKAEIESQRRQASEQFFRKRLDMCYPLWLFA